MFVKDYKSKKSFLLYKISKISKSKIVKSTRNKQEMDSKSHNKHLHPLEVTEENESTAILDTYRYVNGRRFHNVTGVEYFMPNDEQVSLK